MKSGVTVNSLTFTAVTVRFVREADLGAERSERRLPALCVDRHGRPLADIDAWRSERQERALCVNSLFVLRALAAQKMLQERRLGADTQREKWSFF